MGYNTKQMVKMRLPRIVLSAPRLLAAVVLAGTALTGTSYAVVRQLSAQPPHPPTATATTRQGTTSGTAPQPVATAPTPATTAPATPAPPTPRPAPPVAVTHSATPAPVVTPSGNASVNGLAPVNPTPAPPDDSSSSSSSSGSSTPPPDSSASTPPQQTTGYTSTNWSGYLAAGARYTAVAGSWTVPVATGVAGKTSADTAWVGIGGVTTSDLIQAGTIDSVSAGGRETVQAFYELLPYSAHIINTLAVTPGDVMSVTITETSADNWHIVVNDITSGASYSTNVLYASALSSAEWIEEDPSQRVNGTITLMPLDNFAPVSFTGGTTTSSGAAQSIAGSDALPVTLVADHSNTVLAAPTALGSDGQSFTVSRTSQ